jgi:hypothetical protein
MLSTSTPDWISPMFHDVDLQISMLSKLYNMRGTSLIFFVASVYERLFVLIANDNFR